MAPPSLTFEAALTDAPESLSYTSTTDTLTPHFIYKMQFLYNISMAGIALAALASAVSATPPFLPLPTTTQTQR